MLFRSIASGGVPLDKIVIGKPATQKDANNGYIDPQTLAGCISQAKQKNWNAGVMVWQVSSIICITLNYQDC